jgi:hypothetical protein
MSLLMALMYLMAGIVCINRPALIVKWLAAMLKSAGIPKQPAWLQGRGVVFFIRLMGFLSLINAVMYFYLAQNPPQTITP